MLFLIVISIFTYANDLGDWGRWGEIQSGIYYRVKCVSWNKYSEKYVWEVEVDNQTSYDLGISIVVSDSGQPEDWRRNSSIYSEDSYVFPLFAVFVHIY